MLWISNLGGTHNPEGRTKEEEGNRTSKKEINELPQKQLAKKQSPDTQRIDSSLKAAKMDGYVKGHAGQVLHVADRLQSDGYEDGWLHWGSC